MAALALVSVQSAPETEMAALVSVQSAPETEMAAWVSAPDSGKAAPSFFFSPLPIGHWPVPLAGRFKSLFASLVWPRVVFRKVAQWKVLLVRPS